MSLFLETCNDNHSPLLSPREGVDTGIVDTNISSSIAYLSHSTRSEVVNHVRLGIVTVAILIFALGQFFEWNKRRGKQVQWVPTKLSSSPKKSGMEDEAINVDSLPGPPTLPLLGNIHQLLASKDMLDTLAVWSMQFTPCFRMCLGSNDPVVVLTSPEAVGALLSSNNNGHLRKSEHYAAMVDYLDEGLVTSHGEKWRARRKLLSPLFHYKCFPNILQVFNRHSKLLAETIGDMFADDKAKPVQAPIFESLLKIICETSMGVDLSDSSTTEFDKFFEDAERCKHYIWTKSVTPWYNVPWLWKLHPFRRTYERNVKDIKDYMLGVIREARNNLQDSSVLSTSTTTAIEMMLNTTRMTMSDSDIREEAHTIISAGHETTAAAIQFALLLLALNPEHQKMCHEEVDRVFFSETVEGRKQCPEGNFTMTSLAELKVVERCAKEALRMFPVANTFTRKLDTPLEIQSGLILPSGTTVVVSATNLHRNPDLFPNPDQFDPSRFTAEACLARHPYAYIPFSGGPRLCLGYKYAMLQMKLVLARLLLHFRWTTTDTMTSVPLEPSIILTPRRGYNFIFHRR